MIEVALNFIGVVAAWVVAGVIVYLLFRMISK